MQSASNQHPHEERQKNITAMQSGKNTECRAARTKDRMKSGKQYLPSEEQSSSPHKKNHSKNITACRAAAVIITMAERQGHNHPMKSG
jgi:hypothetical protein